MWWLPVRPGLTPTWLSQSPGARARFAPASHRFVPQSRSDRETRPRAHLYACCLWCAHLFNIKVKRYKVSEWCKWGGRRSFDDSKINYVLMIEHIMTFNSHFWRFVITNTFRSPCRPNLSSMKDVSIMLDWSTHDALYTSLLYNNWSVYN